MGYTINTTTNFKKLPGSLPPIYRGEYKLILEKPPRPRQTRAYSESDLELSEPELVFTYKRENETTRHNRLVLHVNKLERKYKWSVGSFSDQDSKPNTIYRTPWIEVVGDYVGEPTLLFCWS